MPTARIECLRLLRHSQGATATAAANDDGNGRQNQNRVAPLEPAPASATQALRFCFVCQTVEPLKDETISSFANVRSPKARLGYIQYVNS